MTNQAARRGAADSRRQPADEGYARYADGRDAADYELRGGHHYVQDGYQDYRPEPEEPQEYDPRAYAPNPDQPYDYDANGDPIYYDAPDRRPVQQGRGGLAIVAAVLGLAMLGGVGVLGYRMLGSGGAFSGEPPLIKAETEPVKTAPENPGGAEVPHQNKQIYDRVGGEAAQKSKMVSREEQPVDLPASPAPVSNGDSARVILPGGPASVEPIAPSTMGSAPRRVKTVEIKPDASYDAAPAAPARPNDAIGDLATTGAAPRGSEFDNGILSDDAAPAPRQRPAPTAQQPRPALSPAPTAQASRPVPPAPAAAPAPAPAPAPARPAQAQQPAPQQLAQAPAPRVAPTAPAPQARSGGYVVQVTSQRSDADARAAYAALQRKYPQVLGSYSANIQAATVGDRGTYYRVRVGPFADGAQASQICGSLRAAGGDCVVSRN